jgi:hypothetical protein
LALKRKGKPRVIGVVGSKHIQQIGADI